MGWYLIVGLICISLMIIDAEHPFICLLAIWLSSLEECLFRSSIRFHQFWMLNCMSSLYILSIDLLLDILFGNILFCWWFPSWCKSFLIDFYRICLFLLLLPTSNFTFKNIPLLKQGSKWSEQIIPYYLIRRHFKDTYITQTIFLFTVRKCKNKTIFNKNVYIIWKKWL